MTRAMLPSAAMKRLVAVAMAACVAGCGGLGPGYLQQAALGQWALLDARRPIGEVIDDTKLSPRLRALLAEVGPTKRFGERNGLRPTESFGDYSEAGPTHLVWVVNACDPLSFRPVVWSFPIVGSITYVGWFDRRDADEHGAALKAQGLDVYVRGSPAYSTLGWFRDPILSTMITPGDEALGELVETVLHESVHATLYVNGQSYFNESLASFVAEELTDRYLAETRGQQSRQRNSYRAAIEWGKARGHDMHELYGRLSALYAMKIPDNEKLAAKAKLLADAKAALGVTREMNNASVLQYRTYGSGRAELEAMLEACGGFERFWAEMQRIDERSFAKAHQEDFGPALAPLVERCRGVTSASTSPGSSRPGGAAR